MNGSSSHEIALSKFRQGFPSQHYVGASTPFGIIVSVEARLYNAEAIVRSKDGSTATYRLPFLIAHGLQGARG